jgi:membrane-bound metal-dependent hydrolase YbcI (DUF457 family)
MEPFTHALTSLALARSGLQNKTRLATPMLLASGVAADLDLLSRIGGADIYLRLHRTLLHSLLGSVILAGVIAGVFVWLSRKDQQNALPFQRAFAVCLIGAGAHLLLDLCTSSGEQLLWPFHGKWYALDWLAWLDPWILFLLLAGLLLPSLLHMVSEEIGARRKRGPNRGAIVALVLVAVFIGGRAFLHSKAVDMLFSREYHGAVPESVGAFPASASPFNWRGVVDSTFRMEALDFSLAPGSYFDPERTDTHFKPEASPALSAAQRTPVAERFIRYARFPIANIEKREYGYHVILRDLRFVPGSGGWDNIVAVIDMDSELHVQIEQMQFGGDEKP